MVSVRLNTLLAEINDDGLLTFYWHGKIASFCEKPVGILQTIFADAAGRFIFVSDDSLSAFIYDLTLHRIALEFGLPKPVSRGAFLERGRLLLDTNSGEALIVSWHGGGVLESVIVLPSAVSAAPIVSGNTALLPLADGSLTAIDLIQNRAFYGWKVLEEPIARIDMSADRFVITGENGAVKEFDMKAARENVVSLMALDDIAAIRNAIDANCFLIIDDALMEYLENTWEESIYPSVLAFLAEGLRAAAEEIAAPFLFDGAKERALNEAIGYERQLLTLRFASKLKNNPLASRLIESYPILRRTSAAKLFINGLKLACEGAVSLLEQGRIDEAKKSLAPFMKAKKEMCENIIGFHRIFAKALALVKDDDTEAIFEFCGKHPIVKTLPHIAEAFDRSEEIARSIGFFLERHDYLSIFERAKKLFFYPNMPRLDERTQALFDFIDEGDRKKAFNLALKHPFLTDTKPFLRLLARCDDALNRANEAARSGRSDATQRHAAKLSQFPIFRSYIAFLLRIAFTTEMRSVRVSAAVDWEKSLEIYARHFGVDTMLLECLKEQNVQAHMERLQKNLRAYETAGFPETTLIFKDLGSIRRNDSTLRVATLILCLMLILFASWVLTARKTQIIHDPPYRLIDNIPEAAGG
ncbi:MAG: PQQ-like beta-propeller repeat protein [Helicobacteraceae bacterium]|jgi:hypothetical protein|nr:PQQ-like beta-propeller repeat protein [Helicobacteraceae bacterium]